MKETKRITHYLNSLQSTRVPDRIIVAIPQLTSTRFKAMGQFTLTCNSVNWLILDFRSALHKGKRRELGTRPDKVHRAGAAHTFWQDMASQARTPGRAPWIIVHNLLDFLQLTDANKVCDSLDGTFENVIDGDPPSYATIRFGDSPIRIADARNWWNLDMVAMYEALPSSHRSTSDSVADQMLFALSQFVIQWRNWVRHHDLGHFAPTVGAQSLQSFKRMLRSDTVLAHTATKQLAAERSAYFGGRVQAFHTGTFDRAWMIDLTACYPTIMASGLWPTRPFGPRRVIDLRELEEMVGRGSCIALVQFCTDRPCLPTRDGRRLVWPTNQPTWTWLATPELRYGLKHGFIQDVKEAYEYVAQPVFAGWAKKMLRLRKEAAEHPYSAILEPVTKVLANSLHGKFGQRSRRWVETDDGIGPLDADDWSDLGPDDEEPTLYRRRSYRVERLERSGETWDSIPVLAAEINSAARVRLQEMIDIVGRARVLYCDTDGLIVDDEGALRLDAYTVAPVTVHELTNLTINGIRDYAHDDRVVKSGVSRTSTIGRRLNPRWRPDDPTLDPELVFSIPDRTPKE